MPNTTATFLSVLDILATAWEWLRYVLHAGYVRLHPKLTQKHDDAHAPCESLPWGRS